MNFPLTKWSSLGEGLQSFLAASFMNILQSQGHGTTGRMYQEIERHFLQINKVLRKQQISSGNVKHLQKVSCSV